MAVACYSLRVVRWLLDGGRCLLIADCCVVVCCLSCSARWCRFAVGCVACWLLVVGCLLFVACRVVCCLLFGVWCLVCCSVYAVNCLLLVVRDVLCGVCRVACVVWCVLRVVCWLVCAGVPFAVWWLLSVVVCCRLCGVCCLLCVACCVGCVLFVDCRSLFRACCSLCVVCCA